LEYQENALVKTCDLTVIETRGDLVQRAGQLGEAVRENYQKTAAMFEVHKPKLQTPQGKTVLANVRKHYFQECSDVLPYMKAFSEGLGVPFDDVVNLNILLGLAKSKLNECTGFVIVRDGHVVVGQNWDTGRSAAPMAVLEIGRDSMGANTARFTSAVTLDFWSGMNPHGLCMGGCSGPGGDPIGDGNGVTVSLWRGPLFYRCRTIADVRRLAENVPMVGKGTNGVFIDSRGEVLWTQQGAGRFAVAEPETPYGAATGYRPGMNASRSPKEQAEENRWRRFMQLGAEAMKRKGDLVEDVKMILADHHCTDGHPDSAPCRHDGPENSTQFSIITDVSNRRIHYCGQPCENEWKSTNL
jgi:hypothetical protein